MSTQSDFRLAAACCLDSVGTPGASVDPYLFVLLAVLCVALLALGIGAFIVLYLNAPPKNRRPDGGG